MISHSRTSPKQKFIVATEVRLLHRSRQENSEKIYRGERGCSMSVLLNRISLAKI